MAGERILIVEDDPDMAAVLAELMLNNGYAARMARDGKAALAALSEFKPHAMILDYMLPMMGGAALHEQLRGGAHAKLPVLFLSAMPERDLMRGAAFDGCTYYLSKPYKPQDVVQIVSQMVALGANPAGF